ncbi:MAG: hypothetical protein AAFQ83_26645, partial [Bacteroidota bacterium]
ALRDVMKESLIRIEADSVVMISYMSMGDGYGIYLGTYKLRGRSVIFTVVPYFLWLSDEEQARRKEKTYVKFKCKLTREGCLRHVLIPYRIFCPRDNLDSSQLALLDSARFLVKEHLP